MAATTKIYRRNSFEYATLREAAEFHTESGCCSPEAPCKYVAWINVVAPADCLPYDSTAHYGPDATGTAATGNGNGYGRPDPATTKQTALIEKLTAQLAAAGQPFTGKTDGLSRRSASTLIDKLMTLVKALPAATRAGRPTEKQLALLETLFTRIERLSPVPADGVPVSFDALRTALADPNNAEATPRFASALIDELQKMIKTLPAEAASATEDTADAVTEGMYRSADGQAYRVKKSKAGRLYAEKFVAEEYGVAFFDYAPGAIKTLTAADRMTVEEAAALGRQWGVCCVCCRGLTDQNSIAAGIGPVCKRRV